MISRNAELGRDYSKSHTITWHFLHIDIKNVSYFKGINDSKMYKNEFEVFIDLFLYHFGFVFISFI